MAEQTPPTLSIQHFLSETKLHHRHPGEHAIRSQSNMHGVQEARRRDELYRLSWLRAEDRDDGTRTSQALQHNCHEEEDDGDQDSLFDKHKTMTELSRFSIDGIRRVLV